MRSHQATALGLLLVTLLACGTFSPDDEGKSSEGEQAAPAPAATPAPKPAPLPTPVGIEGERVRASHILVSFKGAPKMVFRVSRSRDEAQVRAKSLLKRALAGEDFEKLAVDESDDRTATENKGSLGYFDPQKLPEAIGKTAYALKKDEVAKQLVETPFGFHILKRTD